MHCPVCAHSVTKVIDSRLSSDGTSIRRRRECEACSHRFSTVEEIELLDLTVIKRDGHREVYNKEKIISGIRSSLEKRAYTEESFRSLIHNIENDLAKVSGREITSANIGEIIMKYLKDFDKVAYIRFASVYRAFEDVETFRNVLDDLS